jgi:hypothetical protein
MRTGSTSSRRVNASLLQNTELVKGVSEKQDLRKGGL